MVSISLINSQDGSGTLDFDELEDVISVLLEMECVEHKDSKISARKIFEVRWPVNKCFNISFT